jgi:peptidoglycan-N-acetylglucosamine deacetylase
LQLLEDFFAYVRSFPGVWNPTSEECARYWQAAYPADDTLKLEPSVWRDYPGSLS